MDAVVDYNGGWGYNSKGRKKGRIKAKMEGVSVGVKMKGAAKGCVIQGDEVWQCGAK